MSSQTLLFLTGLEPVPAATIVVAIPTAAIILLTWFVREKFGFERLVINNSLAGIKYSIVGLAYVMLLTFATITVWEKFSLAQTSVIEEASASRAIAALLDPNSEQEKPVISALRNYLEVAIALGWPQLAKEKEAPEAAIALIRLYKAARAFDAIGSQTTQTASEVFKHIDRINDARQTRITLSKGIVPSLLWYVLVIGAMITIGFSLFFGGENLNVQIAMTGMTTVVLLMALLVIVAFDHPFTGAVSISSAPLQMALTDIR